MDVTSRNQRLEIERRLEEKGQRGHVYLPPAGPVIVTTAERNQGLPQNLWVGIGGIVGPARVRVCSPRSRRFAALRPRSAGHGLDRSSAHARGRLLSDDA